MPTQIQNIPGSVEVDLTAEGSWTVSGVSRLETESAKTATPKYRPYPSQLRLISLLREVGVSGVYRLERESSPTLTQIHKPYQSQLRMISLLREAGQGLVCIGWRESPPLLSLKYTNHTRVS